MALRVLLTQRGIAAGCVIVATIIIAGTTFAWRAGGAFLLRHRRART
jgi:hypothetical protein